MPTSVSASLEHKIVRMFADHLAIEVQAPDTDLISAGLLDSLALVELLLRIEQDLGVVIPIDDLDLSDFRSARAIAALVQRRSAQA